MALRRMAAALLLALTFTVAATAQDAPDLGVATAPGDPAAANPDAAPPISMNEEVLALPGDPERPVTLEVTLYKPPGVGPFPLAVFNHGATHANRYRGERYRYTFSAYYFLSRGYAVALPMARGFAGSGGALVHTACDIAKAGELNARDIAGVIDFLARRPDIDASRIVVGGQSFGGWTALGLATLNIPGVKGAVLFSPALRGTDCPFQDQAMAAGAKRFGEEAKIPTLWFYGDNDTIMPADAWRAVFDAYGRPDAELARVGKVGADSHQMLSSAANLPLWTGRVDRFLARLGLPSTPIYPKYLPPPPPRPTHFAALDDAAAVPLVGDKGREAYRKFLTLPPPRAFAIAPGGFSMADGGFDPARHALAACAKAGVVCRLYAVNEAVVWDPKAVFPVPTVRVSMPLSSGAPKPLNFAYAVTSDCRPRGFTTLTITQAPAHGTASVVTHLGHPAFPAGNPFAVCNSAEVQGRSVVYTPKPGYAGPDWLAFEEVTVEGRRKRFEVSFVVR